MNAFMVDFCSDSKICLPLFHWALSICFEKPLKQNECNSLALQKYLSQVPSKQEYIRKSNNKHWSVSSVKDYIWYDLLP